MKLIKGKSQYLRCLAEMNKNKTVLYKKQILLLSKIQQLLYNNFFMTDDNIKPVDKDKNHFLPDFL